MDRKTLIILAALIAVWFLLNQAIDKFFPPVPAPPPSTNAVPALTVTNGAAAAPTAPSAPGGETRFIVDTNAPEELLVVTNENARYTFTSHGGGLKRVELVKFPRTPKRRQVDDRVVTLNEQAKAPSLAVIGDESVQGNGIFQLTRTAEGVRAEQQLPSGLAIVKEFQLSTNYLLNATVRFENRSTNALSLPAHEWVVGTATPINADDDGRGVGIMWYDGDDTEVIVGVSHFSPHGFACMPRQVPLEYRAPMPPPTSTNVVWAAPHNQFFTFIGMPREPAMQVVMRRFDLPRYTGEEAKLIPANGPTPQAYETTLVYPAATLAANQSLQREMLLFTGPKEYRTLARIAAEMNNNVDAVMNFGMFGIFSKALLLGMNWLHAVVGTSYGWAIILITVILKILFWPFTAAQTRMSKRMQALQPQMKAIQEKYKDDPMKAQRKVMEFWKENKVNPASGCLPVLLQMPVFIGFFYMISSAIELRGASFLWIPDLSRPDTLFVIPGLGFIPFIGISGVGLPFNLLPLIMGGTMLWQSHLMPASPGMDPMQQKMMRYLPLVILVFLYNYSAGMALYWTTNNLLTILQTKLTKTLVKEPAKPATPAPAKPSKALTPPPKKKK